MHINPTPCTGNMHKPTFGKPGIRHGLLLTLFLAALCMSACSDLSGGTPPVPTPITQNSAWVPQFKLIGELEMAYVPPGCFVMGNDEGRRDERPAHTICFNAPFWIGRTEVTNAQYGSVGIFEGDEVARTNMTWFEARDFCAARGLRLPTEAEWEYAARGPESYVYPWGNDFDEGNLIFDRNSNGQVYAVGSRPGGASWVGALDMAGNAMEWTSSQYRRYPYDPADGREDQSDEAELRVYRSSITSYIDFAASAAIRFRAAPDSRDWFIGFRCAVTETS